IASIKTCSPACSGARSASARSCSEFCGCQMADNFARIAPKLKPLLLLLSSDQSGEVVAAAAAIKRALKTANLDFHDLVANLTSPPPAARTRQNGTSGSDDDDPDNDISGNWRLMRDHCWRHEQRLRERERDFIQTLNRWRGEPTSRQKNWLRSIYDRIKN